MSGNVCFELGRPKQPYGRMDKIIRRTKEESKWFKRKKSIPKRVSFYQFLQLFVVRLSFLFFTAKNLFYFLYLNSFHPFCNSGIVQKTNKAVVNTVAFHKILHAKSRRSEKPKIQLFNCCWRFIHCMACECSNISRSIYDYGMRKKNIRFRDCNKLNFINYCWLTKIILVTFFVK